MKKSKIALLSCLTFFGAEAKAVLWTNSDFFNRSELRLITIDINGTQEKALTAFTTQEAKNKSSNRHSPILLFGEICDLVTDDYGMRWSISDCPSKTIGSGSFSDRDWKGTVSGVGTYGSESVNVTYRKCTLFDNCAGLRDRLLAIKSSTANSWITRKSDIELCTAIARETPGFAKEALQAEARKRRIYSQCNDLIAKSISKTQNPIAYSQRKDSKTPRWVIELSDYKVCKNYFEEPSGSAAKDLLWQEATLVRRLNCGQILGEIAQEKPVSRQANMLTDEQLCDVAYDSAGLWKSGKLHQQYVTEAKNRDLDCGIKEPNQSIAGTQSVNSAEVQALKERLARLEAEKNATQQAISQDTQSPSIRISSSTTDGARGTISGTATDNTGIAEVLIDGQAVPLDSSGRFSTSTFIPSGGIDVQITAYDLKGLSTTETVRLERDVATQVTKISFDRLNPTTRQVKANSNAIALIVGVAEYEKTAAAEFADKDAQVFFDYAHLKLGIPQNRIQTLVNDKADVVGLLSGINKWLKRSVRQGESDVYIFFAGHGLASDDGDTAYLIPYDGAPDFLERTAISRDEVFREVSSVNPRSVTVFLDTCYSGDTRGESRLIAGRPLGIKLQEQSLPAGFTVLTAAGGDQIAKPLKEAQHGMFSYFLMKGMEGDADSDGNNEITARELHSYVRENVVQQSGGSQVPELQGDGEKVLVRFQ